MEVSTMYEKNEINIKGDDNIVNQIEKQVNLYNFINSK